MRGMICSKYLIVKHPLEQSRMSEQHAQVLDRIRPSRYGHQSRAAEVIDKGLWIDRGRH